MADIYKMVNEFIVQRTKEMESALLGEIREIAIENGIRTEVVLNERAITQAIVKSQKQKPKYDPDGYICCPSCRQSYLLTQIYNYRPNYCPVCGQAIDWED